MKSFELQTLQNGQWLIQAVFDDREIALFEAKRAAEGHRFPCIRVIEEIFNRTDNQFKSRTIFSDGLVGKNDANKWREETAAKIKKFQASKRRNQKHTDARSTRRTQIPKLSKFVVPIVILFVLLTAGLAAMFALQEIFMPR